MFAVFLNGFTKKVISMTKQISKESKVYSYKNNIPLNFDEIALLLAITAIS